MLAHARESSHSISGNLAFSDRTFSSARVIIIVMRAFIQWKGTQKFLIQSLHFTLDILTCFNGFFIKVHNIQIFKVFYTTECYIIQVEKNFQKKLKEVGLSG